MTSKPHLSIFQFINRDIAEKFCKKVHQNKFSYFSVVVCSVNETNYVSEQLKLDKRII